MNETQAEAKLPHLIIKVAHRSAPEDNTEEILIHLRASPSFNNFGDFIAALPPWPWLALAPLMAWQDAMLTLWAPWLAVPGADTRERPRAPFPAGADAPNVHPFPALPGNTD